MNTAQLVPSMDTRKVISFI